MALYSIGASWNPRMSEYNRELKRGLAGIKGLNFAYRLNTWGPKTGPAMIPANAFSGGYVPTPQGLSGPVTWLEGVFGIASPQAMLTNAKDSLNSAIDPLYTLQSTIQNILFAAQKYDSVASSQVQSKAQAVEAEAAGLVSTYQNIQILAQAIINQITAAQTDANLTKEQAAQIEDQVAAFRPQANSLVKAVSSLQDHMNDLVKTAQSGPGLGQSLESAAIHSVSTLTWILGGGALVYFLAPTFLPRMISGIRKSVRA